MDGYALLAGTWALMAFAGLGWATWQRVKLERCGDVIAELEGRVVEAERWAAERSSELMAKQTEVDWLLDENLALRQRVRELEGVPHEGAEGWADGGIPTRTTLEEANRVGMLRLLGEDAE